ncbi:FAD-binding protein [Glarea lozoyensis ATCC 20868]|uniref:FAD-binding protein n=1 Tax=Glarea lozoyensis (strain ATCC 20868 / MF5171) TaxID=1116229 RepID=S3CNP4_GLAL2|nr:FAD-binding protein [Glarea lozoyensis ATCC 20868]EPE28137.1 FAD-binding protein [Glarea lozoyensis ATCC 20868]
MRLLIIVCYLAGLITAQATAAIPDLFTCINKVFASTGDASKRLITPANELYTDARTGEKINDENYPIAIAYAFTTAEVPALLNCATRSRVKPTIRAGGHHFEAYSSLNGTLVIDIAHLNSVSVSSDRKTAVVGAGTRLGGLYVALDAYNTTWTGGICPTVGVAGYIAAGGFNMQMRSMGMAVERVRSIKAVLASGEVVTASKDSHSDLFWAMLGGGGGTYAVALEFTLVLTPLPNSAMLYLNWKNYKDDTAYQIAKKFLEWAPKADPAFTSSIFIYKDQVEVTGWYLGKTQAQLQTLIDSSGFQSISPKNLNQSIVSGNCNTDASRVFGVQGGIFECQPTSPFITFALNAAPDPFTPIPGFPQYQYNETTSAPTVWTAPAWNRLKRKSKSFIIQKDNLMKAAAIKEVVKRIQSIDTDSGITAEWHAWNISGTASQDTAFAWRQKAYAHMEFTVRGSDDAAIEATRTKWMNDLEGYLRPQLGAASYTGYADSKISSNPFKSYFGDNVCRLVRVKRAYDPTNVFTNPLAIPPSVPKGVSC